VIFVAFVLAVFLAMNWYVLARAFFLFELRKGGWFYAALVPLTLCVVVAIPLESRVGNAVTGGLYTAAMVWLGLCWLLLCILLAQQALARLLPLSRRAWGIAVCGLACGPALYAAVNAQTIAVRRETVPGLPLRVVHLSDIHLGSIGPGMLADIVATTNALAPDLVLVTGDLFDNANARTRAATAKLAGLGAPVLFSSGNHETYTGYEKVRTMLAGTPIRWLRNEMVEMAGIRVIGVDDSAGPDLLRSVLDRVAPSPAFTILMNHRPLDVDLASRHRIDLVLSGHVHDGQIWPFNFLVGRFFPHLSGLHESGGGFS
jgi:predicted MPP superfamily phosphohydrolase